MFASPLPLCSWYFSAPLGVLWDFSCSVKSAAALMARPSRAVIQTSELLGYKPCPEFVLAGSSSRSHGDYLFISNLSEHGGMLSAGDPGTTRSRHLICAAAWHAQVGVKKCALQQGELVGDAFWKFIKDKIIEQVQNIC